VKSPATFGAPGLPLRALDKGSSFMRASALAMTEIDSRCLEAFPNWLRSLADDARAFADLVAKDSTPEPGRRAMAAALNYLFKSLDLIPDGIEDLGFIDDAFVMRVAASKIAGTGGGDAVISRLASEADLVKDFLGGDYARLESYVSGLGNSAARGRNVDDIMGDASVRAELVSEVKSWAESYVAPAFQRDPKNLVKLKSFLLTKLPK
jgi:uncharacterized membrane protein YkvA (DUF1232 family)